MFPTPLVVAAPKVVVPAPVKSRVPVAIRFPFNVTGTAPVVERVIPVLTETALKVQRLP